MRLGFIARLSCNASFSFHISIRNMAVQSGIAPLLDLGLASPIGFIENNQVGVWACGPKIPY
jgi:hypothetical protein